MCMESRVINIQVFKKDVSHKKRHDSASVMQEDYIDDQIAKFLQRMASIMSEFELSAKAKRNGWPSSQINDSIVRQGSAGSFEYLNEPKYDGEIAVCALDDIHNADGAVGQMLLRQKQYAHLFLLTINDPPSLEKQPDFYRSLLAIPASMEKQPDGNIFIAANSGIDYAKSAGTITIDSFPALNHKKIFKAVQLVQAKLVA